MSRLGWTTVGAAMVVVASTHCTYPSFTFDGAGGLGTGGATTSSTSHSSSSATTSSTGSGGTGGMPPKMCNVVSQDCGPSERCTLVEPDKAITGCVAVSGAPLSSYDACPGGDHDCPKGTWCDGRTGVCMPFCASKSDCASGQNCVSASYDGSPITSVKVCVSHCEPVSADPCGTGATCAYDTSVLSFDCFTSGNIHWADMCMHAADCERGLVCVGSSSSADCRYWCKTAGQLSADCLGAMCNPFSTPVTYNGVEYGFCTN